MATEAFMAIGAFKVIRRSILGIMSIHGNTSNACGDSSIHVNWRIQGNKNELSWQQEQCRATAEFMATQEHSTQ